MTSLYKSALSKANEIRLKLGLDFYQPINAFDSCIELEITVRFVNINMEGMYFTNPNTGNSNIMLSNQRPLPRRCYTCSHELGHHVFGHGSRVDNLLNEELHEISDNKEELLVDSFAGALLMPIMGIQREFVKRKWQPQNATPLNFYVISSVFGVGYQTLITHCRINNLITHYKAKELLKTTPSKIFKCVFPESESNSSYFKVIDGKSSLSKVDIEVSNYVLVPKHFEIEGNHLERCEETNIGIGYIARKPGITRIYSTNDELSFFLRIQKLNYVGLAEYRHLEDTIDN